jgi:zinc transport system ATP-binding protein
MKYPVVLENVNFRYNEVNVLEDVSLRVGKDELLAIVGPNGGGKTTLLKLLLGLLQPQRGKVRVFGKKPKEGRRRIGYVPQRSSFDPSFPISVFDVAMMGRLRHSGLLKPYSDDDCREVVEALRLVGMEKLLKRQIGSLSGGQIQRTLLARALASKPDLLLLDEPTSSIDPTTRESFYDLLSKLRKNMTIILVTHDVGVISSHVKSMACLNRTLFFHGLVKDGMEKLEDVYECPVEAIAHGVPHRVLKRH